VLIPLALLLLLLLLLLRGKLQRSSPQLIVHEKSPQRKGSVKEKLQQGAKSLREQQTSASPQAAQSADSAAASGAEGAAAAGAAGGKLRQRLSSHAQTLAAPLPEPTAVEQQRKSSTRKSRSSL
jgi:hypothetical protein